MNNRRFLLASAFVLILLALGGAVAQSRAAGGDRIRTDVQMRQKLQITQELLAGIAIEDFNAIAGAAEKLSKQAQSADWRHRETAAYQAWTAEYLRHTAAIARAARKQNIDAVTLNYFQLTVTCVNCHRHLRGKDDSASTGDGARWGSLAAIDAGLNRGAGDKGTR